MVIFARFFIKVFAFLSSVTIFFVLAGLVINLLPQNIESNTFIETGGDLNSNNTIAVLKLNGPILNEPSLFLDLDLFTNINVIYVNQIRKILHDLEQLKIKGLVVSINSPGGSVSASYNLYNLFKNFSNNNSIDIFFHTNELMASGAYWVALSGQKIYANYGSLIGSIGVKGPDWIYFDTPISISTGILGNSIETKNEIKNFNNISGISKDLFNSFRPPTKKEILDLQQTTNNIYSDFVKVVANNRKIESDTIINDIGAMIFDSKTAKEFFLIDDILPSESVVIKMAEYLSLKKYKIIKRRENNKSFFYDLFKSSYFFSKNFNFIEKAVYKDVCDLTKYGLSVIFLKAEINSSC